MRQEIKFLPQRHEVHKAILCVLSGFVGLKIFFIQ